MSSTSGRWASGRACCSTVQRTKTSRSGSTPTRPGILFAYSSVLAECIPSRHSQKRERGGRALDSDDAAMAALASSIAPTGSVSVERAAEHQVRRP